MLVPPDNFGLVEDGVYRCTKIDSDHFPFMETLNLKSLIVLDAEKPPRSLESFLQTNNINLYNIGGLKISNHHNTGVSSSVVDEEYDQMETTMNSVNEIEPISITRESKNDSWMSIEKNLILRAFELILNKNKHNILVIDSSSTLIGILRKIQKWNFNSILNEYRIFAGSASKSNFFAENFLELVQTELIPYEKHANLNTNVKSEPHKDDLNLNDKEINRSTSINILNYSNNNLHYKQRQLSGQSSALHSPCDTYIQEVSKSANPLYESTFPDDDEEDDEDDCDGDGEDGEDGVDEDENIDENDDTDDDLLSASPQIPQNLLKLVEKRKEQRSNSNEGLTPGTSPKSVSQPGILRHNSVSNDVFLSSFGSRRRSSIDTKMWNNNNKFRSNSVHDVSFFASSKQNLKRGSERKKSVDVAELRDSLGISKLKSKTDFKFYKNIHKHPVMYDNVQVIKIRLPPEDKLPKWFVKIRDCWEEQYRQLNGLS